LCAGDFSDGPVQKDLAITSFFSVASAASSSQAQPRISSWRPTACTGSIGPSEAQPSLFATTITAHSKQEIVNNDHLSLAGTAFGPHPEKTVLVSLPFPAGVPPTGSQATGLVSTVNKSVLEPSHYRQAEEADGRTLSHHKHIDHSSSTSFRSVPSACSEVLVEMRDTSHHRHALTMKVERLQQESTSNSVLSLERSSIDNSASYQTLEVVDGLQDVDLEEQKQIFREIEISSLFRAKRLKILEKKQCSIKNAFLKR
jgi:hypothetical protein